MRPEQQSLGFYGEVPQAFAFLRRVEGGLVQKTLDKNLVALDLDVLVNLSLAEATELESLGALEDFYFREATGLSREARLRQELVNRFNGKSLIFRYGKTLAQREAKRVRLLPWGIRGTVNGLRRNFSWNRIETTKVGLPRHYRLEILSKRTLDFRSFSLRFYECDSGGAHLKELKNSGFSTRL